MNAPLATGIWRVRAVDGSVTTVFSALAFHLAGVYEDDTDFIEHKFAELNGSLN